MQERARSHMKHWDLTWHFAGPDHTSFLWKLVHMLLPVKDRLHRLSPATSPICNLCPDNINNNLDHAFNSCSFNHGAGTLLTSVISESFPDANLEQILRLGFDEMPEDLRLPVIWFSAALLLALWNSRCSDTRVRTCDIRAEIESKVSLLRETRFSQHVENLNLLYSKITSV